MSKDYFEKEIEVLDSAISSMPIDQIKAQTIICALAYINYATRRLYGFEAKLIDEPTKTKISVVIDFYNNVLVSEKPKRESAKMIETFKECLEYLKQYKDIELENEHLHGIFDFGHSPDRIIEIYSDFNKKQKESRSKNKNYINGLDELCALILKDGKKVLNLCSYDSHFINLYEDKDTTFYGYDIERESILIGKILSVINTFTFKGFQGDVLQLTDEIIQEGSYDRIFADFPFSVDCPKEQAAKIYHDLDEKIKSNPKSSWIYVASMLKLLDKKGKAALIIPEDILSNTVDKDFRKYLVDNGLVESIVKVDSTKGTSKRKNIALIVLSNNNKKIRYVDLTEENISDYTLDVKKAIRTYDRDYIEIDKKQIEEKEYIIAYDKIIVNKEKHEETFDYEEVPLKDLVIDVFRGYKDSLEKTDLNDYIHGKKDINDKKGIIANLISNKDLNYGIIDAEGMHCFLCPPDLIEKYSLHKNDIVITCKYSTFKAAIVAEEPRFKYFPSGNLMVIRPDTTKIDPYYLKAFLESPEGYDAIESIKTGGSIFSINRLALLNLNIRMYDIKLRNAIGAQCQASIENIIKYHTKLHSECMNLVNTISNCIMLEISKQNK